MFQNKQIHRAMFFIVLLLCGLRAFSQSKNNYKSISIAEGLSQGMVFDILQDKEGFIWVATKNGLNRYDGYNFKIYNNNPYDIHSVSSNLVTELFEDSKGRIWAGTETAGLNVFDKTSGKFYRITNDANNPNSISGNNIRPGITETPDGKILVAANKQGLNVITIPSDFFKKDLTPQIQRITLPDTTEVYGMGTDRNGNIYLCTYNKAVYSYNSKNNIITKLPSHTFFNNGYLMEDGKIWIGKKIILSNENILTPLFDSKNVRAGNIVMRQKENLWDNYMGDVEKYDISRYKEGEGPKWNQNLPQNFSRVIYPFIIDRGGILWAGTKGYGLVKYNTNLGKFKISASGKSTVFIKPENGNEIYISQYPYAWNKLVGDSLFSNPFSKITSNNEIDNFVIAKTGDYWFRSDNEGLFQYNISSKKIIHYPTVIDNGGRGEKQPMMEDSKGNIWFPALNGIFSLINTRTLKINIFSLISNVSKSGTVDIPCTALYEDGDGIFWVGTTDGFAKLIFSEKDFTKPNQVKWYKINTDNKNSLNYNNVSCFLDDPHEPKKYLWICTKGGGLNRIEKSTGNFIHLTKKEGLPNDIVYGILADNKKNIWGSTNRGIFCLEKIGVDKWNIRNFTKSDGLQDDEFNTNAFAKLPNGNLAFGGVNGVNIFDPIEALQTGMLANVYITNILVNNKEIVAGDETGILKNSIEQTKNITLNYLQDILTLEFSCLDLSVPEQNKYRYKLEGIDNDWIESGTHRSATYLHLPSGSYTFKVQGSNSQGSWMDKITELKIKVLPAWWLSWWAYTFYFILLAFLLRWYYKFLKNKAKLQAQLKFEHKESNRIKELDAVKTQLYTNITHEFRTPLTVILGMAKQIESNPAAYTKQGTEMIIRNGESLLKLVNEMLDLSKLQSGKMVLNLASGDMIVFLRYIVESFHSLAESQHKQVHFLSDIASYYTKYDAEKIRQIITNLLSNALKFTPEKGNIYISVNEKPATNSSKETTIIIKIKDTGIGIPEEKLLLIFDRFYQLENSNNGTVEGTGIGLSLTKELVKLMNGEITVKSPPLGTNIGTEFTLDIPLQKISYVSEHINENISDELIEHAYVKTKQQQAHEIQLGNVESPLILLVEDNTDVVAYTASCLPNYRLAVAKNGMEGFDIATEIIPDLIISDVMMPLVNGFELLEKLRNDKQTSHIPIIMLTAKSDTESKMQGLQGGVDAYLEKPFNIEELQIRVKKLLELRKNLQKFYLSQAGLLNKENSTEESLSEAIYIHPQVEDKFIIIVRELIERNIAEPAFTVEDLCKEVFMSHSKLHRKLDALTGCSPNKFIRIIRLKKAKELLKSTDESISSIALDCGFNDPGYFSRVFKQEFGTTPQEWRLGVKV